MKPPLNKKHELAGNELSRLAKIVLFAKVIPVGNLSGGPGLRCLINLMVLHHFGGILYGVQAKYGHRMTEIKRLVSKIKTYKIITRV